MGDISPFDHFRQESSHADAVIRTEAMNKVTIITALLGTEKARSDMIPYLRSTTADLDQVLVVMGQKIGSFIPYIGGPEYAHTLVPLIEALCNIEENVVRNATTVSCNKILQQLQSNHTASIQSFFELFQRLASEEAGELFYGRVCACDFIAELYRVCNATDRVVVKEAYQKLVVDELPMIRRAACLNFLKLSNVVEVEVLSTEMVQILKSMAIDENLTVRSAAVDSISGFAARLKQCNVASTVVAELLPIIKSAVDDHSWKIRQTLAKPYGSLAGSFTPGEVSAELFPGALNLLQDGEPEIRTLTLQGVSSFAPVIGGQQFLAEFIPIVVQLVEDPVANVRKLLVDVCIDVSAIVGPELTAQHLSDVLMRLISDEDPMVRLRVIKKLNEIAARIPSLCTRMTPTLKPMLTDTSWRIRKHLGMAMPDLVRHMGPEYFMENFLTDFLPLLKDGVDEVRVGCASAVPFLVEAAGAQWVHEKIFPSVRALATDEFLVRISMLSALQGLIVQDLPEKFQTDTLALIIGATNDKVPNIRLRAAQVLGLACASIGPENSRTRVRPVLAELLNDKDRDVKYFAAQALRLCA